MQRETKSGGRKSNKPHNPYNRPTPAALFLGTDETWTSVLKFCKLKFIFRSKFNKKRNRWRFWMWNVPLNFLKYAITWKPYASRTWFRTHQLVSSCQWKQHKSILFYKHWFCKRTSIKITSVPKCPYITIIRRIHVSILSHGGHWS